VELLAALRYVALVELRERVTLIEGEEQATVEFLTSVARLYLAHFAADQLALVELAPALRRVAVALVQMEQEQRDGHRHHPVIRVTVS
jgi:hypothetical protein